MISYWNQPRSQRSLSGGHGMALYLVLWLSMYLFEITVFCQFLVLPKKKKKKATTQSLHSICWVLQNTHPGVPLCSSHPLYLIPTNAFWFPANSLAAKWPHPALSLLAPPMVLCKPCALVNRATRCSFTTCTLPAPCLCPYCCHQRHAYPCHLHLSKSHPLFKTLFRRHFDH